MDGPEIWMRNQLTLTLCLLVRAPIATSIDHYGQTLKKEGGRYLPTAHKSDVVDGDCASAAPFVGQKEATLEAILQAITDSHKALELKMDIVIAEMGILQDALRHLTKRVTATEHTQTDLA
ncbi:hypothetical protein NDU88_004444 [Pleurodeles waltl]|uniref:Uncharacterized protein n=1 Tax=Pleurodeles waltl TaxID=8319 RepID=A0AAV7VH47_PLEWA|nr:hypothetical protein NDU88_004444 [Pleurodeles waltl]